ncbi:MAG: nuclear transport factor 2 family protein [Chitinophagales bacterium]|nr:nuclear transport factor 2 family protein [Chitinophagales bacterium]
MSFPINEWLASWTGNQPEQLLSYYTDDAFYLDPANTNGLKGHAQLLPYFGKLLKHNPNWVWTAEEVMPTEKGFTLKWKAAIPINDKTITLFGLDIVELRDGKISRNEVYFDRSEWLKAIR